MIIVDNFYPELNWLHPYLQSSASESKKDVNYAGLVYPPPEAQTLYALNKIEEVFKRNVIRHQTHGEIRLTLKENQNQYKTFVHTDAGWNVVIYLSGQEGVDSGTVFYRHKQLGVSSTDMSAQEQAKMAILYEHDANDLSRWEVIQTVPFKINRAVFFEGKYFHSVPALFYGTDTHSARITQNFFFGDLT